MSDEKTGNIESLDSFFDSLTRKDYSAAESIASMMDDEEARSIMLAIIAGARGDYAGAQALLANPEYLRNPWALRILSSAAYAEKGEEARRLCLSAAFLNGAPLRVIREIQAEHLSAAGLARAAGEQYELTEYADDPYAEIELMLRSRRFGEAGAALAALPKELKEAPDAILLEARLAALNGDAAQAFGLLSEREQSLSEAGYGMPAEVLKIIIRQKLGQTQAVLDAISELGAPLPTISIQTLLLAGRPEEAASEADASLSYALTDEERFAIARLLISAELYQNALSQIEAVPETSDDDMTAYNRRYLHARCLKLLGRNRDANREYESLSRDLKASYINDSQNVGAYYLQAGCLRDTGKRAEALEMASFLMKAYPDDESVKALYADLR